MFRKLTLSFLLTACICLASYSTKITISGSSNAAISANSFDTLYITASGNYTGALSNLNSVNKVIIIDGGGIFNPSSIAPTNGVICTIQNYGTFTYTSSLTTNNGFILNNYAGGVVSLADLTTKGKDQVWTNYTGGLITFSGDVLLNGGTASDDNNKFYNYATITASANFQMNSGSYFTNYKDFNVTGLFKINGGFMENHGKLDATGGITVNAGTSALTNYCKLFSSGPINNSSNSFTNYNYIYANNADITNTGTIVNVDMGLYTTPIIQGKNYTQTSGSVTGNALLYFTGTTSMTGGSGTTMGVSGTTSDTIKVYDLTRTGSQILDGQGGTLYSNVIYNAWGTPDPTASYIAGCSLEVLMEVPLAINWIDFTVAISNNIPSLTWSAEYTEGTVFEIQRSYDGRNFTSIKNVPYENNRSDYSYNDNSVDAGSTFAYYRIRAVELGGTEKYTSVRVVRFASKTGAIHLSPNPFKNNFIVSYNSSKQENILIKIFDMSGQQKLVKSIMANEGNNRIDIGEAAKLANGVYIVQVGNGSSIISSGKIIKQ